LRHSCVLSRSRKGGKTKYPKKWVVLADGQANISDYRPLQVMNSDSPHPLNTSWTAGQWLTRVPEPWQLPTSCSLLLMCRKFTITITTLQFRLVFNQTPKILNDTHNK
jgi:hypothetical protein